jgi:nucleoid-associated protein YgaU
MALNEMAAHIEAEKLAKARAAAERVNKARDDSIKMAKEKEEALKKAQAEILAKPNAAQSVGKAAPGVTGSAPLGATSGMLGMGKGPTAAAQAPKTAVYTVKKGDTLSQIAKNFYGFATPPYWKLIQDANKDLIKDANLIYPGQVFKIPELPEALKKK